MSFALPSDPSVTIFQDLALMRARVEQYRRDAKRVGVVPTMGALHEGHLSLVRASLARCDRTVVTIFVNPTQFGPGEDFEQYPRTLDRDIEKLAAAGQVDVFAPTAVDLYPPDHSTSIEPPHVARLLEGEFRPTHFAGVATIVLKLFQIVPAHMAFFGQKDFQQCRVIEQMVIDLNLPVEIVRCPIVREPDGLAMSSRNAYLDDAERSRALSLHHALRRAGELVDQGQCEIPVLEAAMRDTLRAGQVDAIDYATIADARTMQPLDHWTTPAVALIAAHVGQTRLIDNLLWTGES